MNILNQPSEIVMCVTSTGDLKQVDTNNPKVNSYEIQGFYELLKENKLITQHETKDVFVNVSIESDNLEIKHMLKSENGLVDTETMSGFNITIDKELLYVPS